MQRCLQGIFTGAGDTEVKVPIMSGTTEDVFVRQTGQKPATSWEALGLFSHALLPPAGLKPTVLCRMSYCPTDSLQDSHRTLSAPGLCDCVCQWHSIRWRHRPEQGVAQENLAPASQQAFSNLGPPNRPKDGNGFFAFEDAKMGRKWAKMGQKLAGEGKLGVKI